MNDLSSSAASQPEIEWFFDFVSPFSYLQWKQFQQWPVPPRIQAIPILFGAVLNHWGQKAPAEIEPKRVFTYRYAQFRAQQLGIAYRMPPAHPFNPIKALRLALALGTAPATVDAIFAFIWGEGHDPSDQKAFATLCGRLGVTDPSVIEAPAVKQTLRENTERAIAQQVFGVPTSVLRGALFWGEDAGAMLQACLRDPTWLDTAEIRRISALPVGVQRG